MRILCIQLNQPGDAILTTPTWRWLIRQGHEVHVLVQPLAAELLSTMPGLSGVNGLRRGGSYQIGRDFRRWRNYRSIGFDWAIVFSKCSERPSLWARLSGAKRRTGLFSAGYPRLLRPLHFINDWCPGYPPWAQHVVEQHFFLAGGSPGDTATAQLEYAPTEEARDWQQQWRRAHPGFESGYIHFHLTARWPSKCWPVSHTLDFIRAAQKEMPWPLLLTTGPAEFETNYARQVLAEIPSVTTEIGTLKPHQLGALIAGCRAFVGMDSMPMHLAVALQKPGVTLFGPTHPEQWGPWRSPLRLIRSEDESREMEFLPASRVLDELRTALGGTDKPVASHL